MDHSCSPKPISSEPIIDLWDESTETYSESSEEDAAPARLLDHSQLHLAVRHWDAALEPFGAAAGNEQNAAAFSRFLWRLDIAIDARGRNARLDVAPWLRTLADDEHVRRACFRIAAEEEGNGRRDIVGMYEEMRDVR